MTAHRFRAQPPRTASPLVRQLFKMIDDAGGVSHGRVAKRIGVSFPTLSKWRHGKCSPRVVDFENAAQVLGYKIVFVPRDEARS